MNTPSNRNAEGIALVSALMVLVVIMILGVASMQLTQTNLMNTNNHRSTALAKQNANSGIDAALLVLQHHVAATGNLPKDLKEPEMNVGDNVLDFEFEGYSVETKGLEERFSLRVKGYGQRKTDVYVSEVTGLVALEHDRDEGVSGNRRFFPGVYAGQSFTNSGRTTLIDAGLHASYDLRPKNGFTPAECTSRLPTGICIQQKDIPYETAPVTALIGAVCEHSWPDDYRICEGAGESKIATQHSLQQDPGFDPLTGEYLYEPDPTSVRNAALCMAALGSACNKSDWTNYTTYRDVIDAPRYSNCDYSISRDVTVTEANAKGSFEAIFGGVRPNSGSVICVASGVTVKLHGYSDWNNYTIINDGEFTDILHLRLQPDSCSFKVGFQPFGFRL